VEDAGMPTLGRQTEDGLELDLEHAACDWCHRTPDQAPRVMSTGLGIHPTGEEREVYTIICSHCVGQMARAFVTQGVLSPEDVTPDPRAGLLDFRKLADEWKP
jgi:hypothetical protein